MLSVKLRFMREFVKSPLSTGAIYPSSRSLAQVIVEPEQIANAKCVIEFGPGTGVFTEFICQNIKEDTVFFGIEKNEHLVSVLKKFYPGKDFYCDSVVNVENYLKKYNTPYADIIISGLPWASFSDEIQTEFLQKTVKALRKGGMFSTFAYLHGKVVPSGIRFARKLQTFFKKVEKSPVIWRNLPPAFVYRCIK